MVTADPSHREILKDLVENYQDADSALGKRVGFVLFGGNVEDFTEVNLGRGSLSFIPGEFVQPLRSYVADDQQDWMSMSADGHRSKLFKWQIDELASRTAKLADDWMEFLSVKRRDLPALCVVVKGAESFVIPLGPQINLQEVLRLFGKLADIAQRDTSASAARQIDAEQRVKHSLKLKANVTDLEASFVRHLESMCNRFRATNSQRELVASFISLENYAESALQRLFDELKFAEPEEFNKNSTVRGVRNKARQLKAAVVELEASLPTQEMVVSLEESLRTLRARRDETTALVRQLQIDGIGAKTVEQASFGDRYDVVVSRANQAASLIEKAGKLFEYVKEAGFFLNMLR